jgi:hypothetical protein
MHTGKELEAQGRFSCDSDAPHVGSARSESARVVKVNRPKTNSRKSRPYCTCVFTCSFGQNYLYWVSIRIKTL